MSLLCDAKEEDELFSNVCIVRLSYDLASLLRTSGIPIGLMALTACLALDMAEAAACAARHRIRPSVLCRAGFPRDN